MDTRTDEEIVRQTNELAIAIGEAMGYERASDAPPIYWSHSPRSKLFWRLACIAQEHLTATDPEDALSGIEVDEPLLTQVNGLPDFVSADQVYQRRRVWETFADVFVNYSNLRWSHFYAALEWDDAHVCLQWADELQAGVAEMKAWRRAQRGEVE